MWRTPMRTTRGHRATREVAHITVVIWQGSRRPRCLASRSTSGAVSSAAASQDKRGAGVRVACAAPTESHKHALGTIQARRGAAAGTSRGGTLTWLHLQLAQRHKDASHILRIGLLQRCLVLLQQRLHHAAHAQLQLG